MATADHGKAEVVLALASFCFPGLTNSGPAVSGAHNTIVTTRAGKGLVDSLVAGLLTIGPRFGGAIDDAAEMFSHAYDIGQTPREFVNDMRRQGKLIMGIGHKVLLECFPPLGLPRFEGRLRSTDAIHFSVRLRSPPN